MDNVEDLQRNMINSIASIEGDGWLQDSPFLEVRCIFRKQVHGLVRKTHLPDLVHGAADATRAVGRLQGGGGSRLGLLHAVNRVVQPPHLQSLVGSGRDQSSSVRRLGEVQDTGSVSGKFRGLSHGRILPRADLVLREPVGRDELLTMDRPLESAHLRLGINGVQELAGCSVPEFNRAISCTPSSSKQRWLPRAPGQRLDGSLVFLERELRRLLAKLPEVEYVVITTGSELLSVKAPLKSADLSRVASEGRHEGVTSTNVPVTNRRVKGTGREDVTVPGDGTNAAIVALQFADGCTTGGVPHLNEVAVEAYG